jgi:hypothetical protein
MKFFCFKPLYFLLTIVLFVSEVLIAIYIHDSIVRPYGGDYLVVILIYCFVRSFFRVPVIPAAIAVLLFSFLIEFLQYIDIVNKLGLDHSSLARTIIGTSFAWADILAYILGILTVVLIEFIFRVIQKNRYAQRTS